MAYIDIVGGKTYTGKTVWSIVRRVWGKSKQLRVKRMGGSDSPTWGYVLQSCDNGYIVVAHIYDLSGPMGIDNEGNDADEDYTEE